MGFSVLFPFLSCLIPEARQVGAFRRQGRLAMQRGLVSALFSFLQLFGNAFPWRWQQALLLHVRNAPPKTSRFWSLRSQQELQRPLRDYSCWQSWMEALSRPRSRSACSDTDGVPGGPLAEAKSCSYSLWNWTTYLCPPIWVPFYHLLFLPRGQWEAPPGFHQGVCWEGKCTSKWRYMFWPQEEG